MAKRATSSSSKRSSVALSSAELSFTGFPAELQGFLTDLRAHNTKKWFDTNRDVYDEHAMRSARLFVPAAHEALRVVAPTIQCDARVNGSIRDAVVDKKAGAALRRAVATTERAGYAVRGEKYKRAPKGYEEVSGLSERLVRHGGLWCGEDESTPKSFSSKRFVDWCVTRWKKTAPLHRWLVKTLQ